MKYSNKILLFEDFTKLYKRWNKGNVRKEDEFNSNIYDLHCIDLGSNFNILFADKDLIVNNVDKFTNYELTNFLSKIEKEGWRLPTYAEIQKMFYGGTQPPKPNKNLTFDWIPKKYGIVYSPENDETITFNTDKKFGEDYWCDPETPNDRATSRGFEVGEPSSYYGCLIRTNNFNKDEYCKIRLIKDK